jgi:hypothetical protein
MESTEDSYTNWKHDLSETSIKDHAKYYKVSKACHNCNHMNELYIRKGTRITQVDVDCTNCACKL